MPEYPILEGVVVGRNQGRKRYRITAEGPLRPISVEVQGDNQEEALENVSQFMAMQIVGQVLELHNGRIEDVRKNGQDFTGKVDVTEVIETHGVH